MFVYSHVKLVGERIFQIPAIKGFDERTHTKLSTRKTKHIWNTGIVQNAIAGISEPVSRYLKSEL